MKRIKVIHLIESLDSGGCENMLLRTLPLIKFDHTIITLRSEGELAARFNAEGVGVISLSQKNLLDVRSYLKLRDLMNEEKPDIVFTYLLRSDIVGRLILPLFYKQAVIPFLRSTYNHPKYWLARFFEFSTKLLVKHYLANSEAVKTFYVRNIGVAENKITVIPNGIDAALFMSQPNQTLRSALNISQEECVIACVANLHKNKGHSLLLEAFERIYKEKNGTKLLIVGTGAEENNLKLQIQNYQSKNNILFLGRRSDVADILSLSHIFVLPTMFEGLSNAIMEAMAAGLAIVTTDIPENRELITDNQNGLLAKPNDPEDIYRQLHQLVDDGSLRRKLGNNARISIKHYELNHIATSWCDTTQSLISR